MRWPEDLFFFSFCSVLSSFSDSQTQWRVNPRYFSSLSPPFSPPFERHHLLHISNKRDGSNMCDGKKSGCSSFFFLPLFSLLLRHVLAFFANHRSVVFSLVYGFDWRRRINEQRKLPDIFLRGEKLHDERSTIEIDREERDESNERLRRWLFPSALSTLMTQRRTHFITS